MNMIRTVVDLGAAAEHDRPVQARQRDHLAGRRVTHRLRTQVSDDIGLGRPGDGHRDDGDQDGGERGAP
jgi:hypothetical protein